MVPCTRSPGLDSQSCVTYALIAFLLLTASSWVATMDMSLPFVSIQHTSSVLTLANSMSSLIASVNFPFGIPQPRLPSRTMSSIPGPGPADVRHFLSYKGRSLAMLRACSAFTLTHEQTTLNDMLKLRLGFISWSRMLLLLVTALPSVPEIQIGILSDVYGLDDLESIGDTIDDHCMEKTLASLLWLDVTVRRDSQT